MEKIGRFNFGNVITNGTQILSVGSTTSGGLIRSVKKDDASTMLNNGGQSYPHEEGERLDEYGNPIETKEATPYEPEKEDGPVGFANPKTSLGSGVVNSDETRMTYRQNEYPIQFDSEQKENIIRRVMSNIDWIKMFSETEGGLGNADV